MFFLVSRFLFEKPKLWKNNDTENFFFLMKKSFIDLLSELNQKNPQMKKILFLSLIVIVLFSCKKEKAAEPKIAVNTSNCDTTITYTSQIKAIIDSKCVSCHAGSGPGPHDYRTYLGFKPHVDDGHINNRVVVLQDMPQGSSLSSADISTISCWIQNGAKE